MQQLLRLFESTVPPRGSVLGVWGELLVAASSSQPGAMVDAWHAQIDDRFDFASEGSRLEVKTTTRPARIHHFGLGQLLPVPGASRYVVSIMTAESQPGTCVADLVGDLQQQLAGSPVRQLKVLEQVAATLGPDWPVTASRTFDMDAGLASLAVFDADEVPRVEPGPPAVTDVALTVDLTGVDVIDVAELRDLGTLVRASS
jgi:hypothetical protein